MDMHCPACGRKFRTMTAEAKHRHNFPALCARNARFRAWEAENREEDASEAKSREVHEE